MAPVTHQEVEHTVDRAIQARTETCNQRLVPIEEAIADIRAMRVELTTACSEWKGTSLTIKKLDKIVCGADEDANDLGLVGEVKELGKIRDGITWGKKKVIGAIIGVGVVAAPGWVAAIVAALKEAIKQGVITP